MVETLVPSIDFSPAKSQLSSLMDLVFHAHQPYLVLRHRGKEQMLLLRPDDVLRLLSDMRIDVQAVFDKGEVTLRTPDLGVLGFGSTLDEAIDDLLSELRDYARDYFGEPDRYRGPDRTSHFGPLLRFALTPAEDQRRLLHGLESPADVVA